MPTHTMLFHYLVVVVSCEVVSDPSRPPGQWSSRPFCPLPFPWAHWSSHRLLQWLHPATSFSVVPFFFCPQLLPALGSSPGSPSFSWGGQSIWVSSLRSGLLKNSQGGSPLRLTGLFALQSKGLARVFSSTRVQKLQFFDARPSLWSNFHSHTLQLGRP